MSDSRDTSASGDDCGLDAVEPPQRCRQHLGAEPAGASRRAGPIWARVIAFPHRAAILTVLFFAGWSLLLAFPYFGFGSMSFVVLHDTAEMNLPRAVWYGRAPAATGVGSWAPMGVSGNDRLASGLATDLDTLFFMVMPGWLAYGSFMWLQRFVAGYFFYRLLREWKKVTPPAAAAVSCAYALFTQPHINMGWAGFALYDGLALPGLPLALYVLFRSAGWRARYRYPVAAATGLFIAFSSHFFVALFGVLAVTAVALVGFPCRDRKSFWVAPALFAAAWLAGESPVLWAAAANAGWSHRGDRALLAATTSRGVVYRTWLPKFLNDNRLALVLTLWATVAAAWRRSRRVLAVAGIAAMCVLLVVWAPSLRDHVFAHLGPLSGFRFDRMFVVLPFLTLLAGGLGLGLLPRLSPAFTVRRRGRKLRGSTGSAGPGSKQASPATASSAQKTAAGRPPDPGQIPGGPAVRPLERRYRVPVQALVGLAIFLGVLVQTVGVQIRISEEMAKGATYESLYGSPQIEELAAGQRRDDPFRVVSVNAPLASEAGHTWHPGYAWAYGLETADGYSVLYSQRYQDLWLRVIDARIGRSREIKAYFKRWGNRVYLFASRNYLKNPLGIMPSKRWNLSLLSLANVRYFISPVKLRDESLRLLPYRRRPEQVAWLGLSPGERREVAGRGEFPGLPLYIYRNKEAFPRAFLVERAAVFGHPRQVLDAMAAAGVNGLRSTVFLTKADAAALGLDAKSLPATPPTASRRQTGAAAVASDDNRAAGGREGTWTGDAARTAVAGTVAAVPDDAVRVVSYEADTVVLRVAARTRSVLIVTNSFSRFWQARIDGERVPLAPADHAFLGVVVPEGEHEVTLSYEPAYGFLWWQ